MLCDYWHEILPMPLGDEFARKSLQECGWNARNWSLEDITLQ